MFNGNDIILVAPGYGLNDPTLEFSETNPYVGQIGYSLNGVNWLKATLPADLFSNGGKCNNITYAANQRCWVAAGYGLNDNNISVGQIGYSLDGINWLKATLPTDLFSGGFCSNITYDANQRLWVAAGYGLKNATLANSETNPSVGQIGYSTDGINWQKATLNDGLFSGIGIMSEDIFSNGKCNNITYDATQRLWVAAGQGVKDATLANSDTNPKVGQIGYSTDGINWFKATLNDGLFSGNGTIAGDDFNNGDCNNITYDASQRQWVAAGVGLKNATLPYDFVTNPQVGQIGYSNDGINWQKATLPTDLFSNGGNCLNITYDASQRQWVAAGKGLKDATLENSETNRQVGQIGYSTYGINWFKATLNDGLFSGNGGMGYVNGTCNNITYDTSQRQWVAAGVGLKDATLANSDTNSKVGQIGYSTDGINWFKATLNDGLFSGNGGDIVTDSGYYNGTCYNITYDATQRQWVAAGFGFKNATLPYSDTNPLVGQIGYSLDGVNWRKSPLPTNLFNDNGDCLNIIYSPPPPIVSDICFVGGSQVTTDQGRVSIENVTTNHTIRGKPVQHVTRTISKDNYLILIKQGALGANKPCVDTRVSKDHKIDVKGKLVEAYRLLNISREIKKIKYSGELLYNVLLAEKGTMVVNNLRCETLDPKNNIALLYNGLDKTTRADKTPLPKQKLILPN